MVIGTLASIWRYPVKSLRAEELHATELTPEGIPGDRSSALYVDDGQPRAGKPYTGMQHERLHLTRDAGEAAGMANQRGVRVSMRSGDRYHFDAPLSLIVDCWMSALDEHAGYAVEPLRFRPNLYVRAGGGWDELEESLRGAAVALGGARLRVRYPIQRCVVTTYDPNTGDADRRILRFVAQRRKAIMGVYCDVTTAGSICAGDVLTLAP
jgi:uncharacterized protein YcbX